MSAGSVRSVTSRGGLDSDVNSVTIVVRQGNIETRRSSAQLNITADGGLDLEGAAEEEDAEALLAWTDALDITDVAEDGSDDDNEGDAEEQNGDAHAPAEA